MFGEIFNRFEPRDRTLTNLILDAAERHGARPYLAFAGAEAERMSFEEVPDVVARIAGGLRGIGVERGDILAFLLENSRELVTTSWGNAWLGGISAPMNPELRGDMLHRLLARAEARGLVITADQAAAVAPVVRRLPKLRTVIVLGEAPDVDMGQVDVVPWSALTDAAAVDPVRVSFSDPLMVLHTSGTTGGSKGVVIPHHYAYCWAVPLVERMGWSPSDHLWTPMPLHHIGAQTCSLIAGLASGSRVTLAARFSASRFWQQLVDSGATHAMIIGTMTAILLKQDPSPLERRHRLKTLWCAPSPVEPREIEERFGVHLIYQGYGMTETYPVSAQFEQAPRGRTCVGRATELYDLKLVDGDDLDVPADGVTPGEIVVRPRLPFAMMTEYLNDPAATAHAFRNLWFHTGDLATMDADGYLYLVGRNTDTIRRRGENVSAVELEQTAMTHEAVQAAAAYGIPSELGEEDVKLDVILAPGHDLDPEELIAFLADRLPAAMVPRYLQYRDSFPMTPTQRIQKFQLREEGTSKVTLDRGSGSRTTTT